MATPLRQPVRSDAAAEELWRAAENGDVEELDRLCSHGVDVNARNRHGMTALMRAAYHGHAQMVRALLRRGADPNLARNDKFTALALAAFFGHTETVRILIEHGAKTEVITRCGASAKTWAVARTFDEAARCLEPVSAPAPEPLVRRVTPAPVVAPESPAPSIRTLKEPPEIWDLVHEVPREFNPRSAFVTRLKSMRTSFAVWAAAVVVISGVCVGGAVVVRRSRTHGPLPQPRVTQSLVGNEVKAPSSFETTTTTPSVAPAAPEVAEFSHSSAPAISVDKPLRKSTSLTRQTRPRSSPVEEPTQSVESREVETPPVVVASPRIEQPKPAKPNMPLSPQVISPAKSAPPKGKVIQWP